MDKEHNAERANLRPFIATLCVLVIIIIGLAVSIIVININTTIADQEKAIEIAELNSDCHSQYPNSETPLANCTELDEAMQAYEEGGIEAVDAYYQDFVDASNNDIDIATTRAKQVIALTMRFDATIQEVEQIIPLVDTDLIPNDILPDYYNALYVFYLINDDEDTAKKYYYLYTSLLDSVVSEGGIEQEVVGGQING